MAQNIFFYNNTSLAESITDATALYGKQTTGTILEFQKNYGQVKDIPNTYDNIVQFTGNENVTTWDTVNGKQVLTNNKFVENAGNVTTEVTGVLTLLGIADVFKQACLAMGVDGWVIERADENLYGYLYPAYQYLCSMKNVNELRMNEARIACEVTADGKLRVQKNFVEDVAEAIKGAGLAYSTTQLDLEAGSTYNLSDIHLNHDMGIVWEKFRRCISVNSDDANSMTRINAVAKNSVAVQARNELLHYLSVNHLDYNTLWYDFSVVDDLKIGIGHNASFTATVIAYLLPQQIKIGAKSPYQTYYNNYYYAISNDTKPVFVKGIQVTYTWDTYLDRYSTSANFIDSFQYGFIFGFEGSTGEAGYLTLRGNPTTITPVLPEGIEYIGDPLTADGGLLGKQYPAWMLNALNGLVPLGYGQNLGVDPQAGAQEGVIEDVAPYPWEETLPAFEIDPINPNEPPIQPNTPDPIPDFPPLPIVIPSYDANKLFSVHTIDANNMNTLGGYLWSSSFASLIEHMFSEPIHAVLGLHELHYGGTISVGSSEEIKLGAFGSGAHGNLVTNRYLEFSCGSITVKEHYGNVEDYDPYTKLQLYLPYVGFVPIATNEVMGKKVTVKYGIDVYTGGCVARVIVTNNGVEQELYNFQGQCGCQLPVTSADYSSLVSRPLIGAALGAVTGGAVGAITGGIGGLASARIDYNRTNGFNSNTGVMLRQKPMLLIERPIAFNAQSYPAFYGNPTNWTVTLSECSGYTRVKDIHIDKTKATDEEKLEIERLLKEGVIL